MTETSDDLDAYRMRELADGLERLAGEARELATAESRRGQPELRRTETTANSALADAWAMAPLALRLKFARELLPEECALQPALRQACAIEDLSRRGTELETWLVGYPSLFADAVQLLADGVMYSGDTAPQALGISTISEALTTVRLTVKQFGVEWITPRPGGILGSEHDVVGEEPSEYHRGSLARVVRFGFRRHGKLELPAQVMRSVGPSVDGAPLPVRAANAEADLDSILIGPERTQRLAANSLSDASAAPEWLRILNQNLYGCDLPAVGRLLDQLQAVVQFASVPQFLNDAAARENLVELAEPLLPLLGMRYADALTGIPENWGAPLLDARAPILLWLRETLSLELVNPLRADRFDDEYMETAETRRTVHANENETVARVERVGLSCSGSPLIRARVVRYAAGRDN